MKEPTDKLELRLDHAATPARVARATQMLAQIFEAFDPEDALDESTTPSITVVVSNYLTRATVRVWNDVADVKVGAVAAFIRSPENAPLAEEFGAPIAEALAAYAREEARFLPSFWSGDGQRLRSVDDDFADEVEKAVKQKKVRPPRVLGATYITSRLYRLGQKDVNSQFRVRLLMPDGEYADVAVDAAAVPDFKRSFDIAEPREYRIKLIGNWIRRGESIEFFPDNKLKAVAVDDRTAVGNTRALLSEPPRLKRADAAALLRKLQSEDGDDD